MDFEDLKKNLARFDPGKLPKSKNFSINLLNFDEDLMKMDENFKKQKYGENNFPNISRFSRLKLKFGILLPGQIAKSIF